MRYQSTADRDMTGLGNLVTGSNYAYFTLTYLPTGHSDQYSNTTDMMRFLHLIHD